MFRAIGLVFLALALTTLSGCGGGSTPRAGWETVDTVGEPTARHEAAFVAHKGKLYLIGGRRINPVDVYDPATKTWSALSPTPIELHHFQAVSYGDAIYIIGAMTGGWPTETPVERVLKYYPERDLFEWGDEIPQSRRRGGTGAAVYDGEIYLVGGITNGHMDGSVAWADVYNPATGAWRVLPDAPHARDHFHAAFVGGRLYAQGGRRTLYRDGFSFELTTAYGDVFDVKTGDWTRVLESDAIPTQRAGGFAIAHGTQLITGGGESGAQIAAHDDVEVYDTVSRQWSAWPDLVQGRHGSGFAVLDGYLYVASGCGQRGGEPELRTLERLKLPDARELAPPEMSNARVVVKQWHPMALNFAGPDASEDAAVNPFTDYRLEVTFTHPNASYTVRGFYAADGDAGETSADSGNVWRVRFAPDRVGEWTWSAQMRTGEMIALERGADVGEAVALEKASGTFLVEGNDKDGPDFRAHGRLTVDNGYFRQGAGGSYWLKGGTNSPENLLGYVDFDGTYRTSEQVRDGESNVGTELHRFEPHFGDWQLGDPSWQGGKGKALIGAMNYLADAGMNSAYFLTMNIDGDGKDVWPFVSHDDFTRFDVSKLDQWNVVFDHMQARGILLHMVIQETENELLFDGGETGPERQLYLNELIARFGHHPGLIWNLGEENGPVHWRPEGQNDQQRMDMAAYLKLADPYQHPVLLHTHSETADKDHILSPLLGVEALDGLSFQVSDREQVNAETRKWRALATAAGQPWLITMDEIGMWHTGAPPDADDPTRDSLRRHAMWGHLLGGGAGVEWYFGAHFPANDLTSEDWRLRAELWRQTRVALTFFREHLPWWEMTPCEAGGPYCFGKDGEVYAIYMDAGAEAALSIKHVYEVNWFDPVAGGDLVEGGFAKSNHVDPFTIVPPSADKDWVVLLKRF